MAFLVANGGKLSGAVECIEHPPTPCHFATAGGGPAMTVHHNTRPIEERFWSKVRKTETCWLWTASTVQGYGQIPTPRIGIRTAHRMAWHLLCGPIPKGMSVLHRCDVRACVNPDHLFLGTTLDNNRDAVAKGRNTHGEKTVGSRLREESIHAIAELRAVGLSAEQISKRFSVSIRTISKVLRAETWAHVYVDWVTVNNQHQISRKLESERKRLNKRAMERTRNRLRYLRLKSSNGTVS